MLGRKVYSGWAFDENATQKHKINTQIFQELEKKVKYIYGSMVVSSDDMLQLCCMQYMGSGYANMKFRVLSNPYGFSNDELALIADRGNLCFGYRMEGSDVVVVYTD